MSWGRAGRVRGDRTKGAAAVEFALMLPLVLLLIAGIVDFGRAFYYQVTLTNAAREGARAAALSGASLTDVQVRAQTSAPALPLSTSGSTTCTAPTGNATVTAGAPFQWILLGPAASLIGASASLPANLSATAVMKCGG